MTVKELFSSLFLQRYNNPEYVDLVLSRSNPNRGVIQHIGTPQNVAVEDNSTVFRTQKKLYSHLQLPFPNHTVKKLTVAEDDTVVVTVSDLSVYLSKAQQNKLKHLFSNVFDFTDLPNYTLSELSVEFMNFDKEPAGLDKNIRLRSSTLTSTIQNPITDRSELESILDEYYNETGYSLDIKPDHTHPKISVNLAFVNFAEKEGPVNTLRSLLTTWFPSPSFSNIIYPVTNTSQRLDIQFNEQTIDIKKVKSYTLESPKDNN